LNTSTKAVIGLASALVVGAAAAGCGYLTMSHGASVATVDGHAIPVSEFNQAVEQVKKQYGGQFGVDFNSPQGKQMLQGIQRNIVSQLIDRELLLSEAEKQGIKASDADVDAKLAEIKKQFPNDAAFQKGLSDNGMTIDELKRRISKGLVIEKLQKATTRNVAVTDAQVADFYKLHPEQFTHPAEISARHILVQFDQKAKNPAKEDARALAKIKGIQSQLLHGGDFAKLAAANSDDPGSKDRGGELGFFTKGRMVPEFEKATFGLKKGQISSPVKTKFGYHLIQREDEHPAHVDSLASASVQIRQQLGQQQERQAFQTYIAGLKKQAKIEIKPEYQPKDEAPEKK